MYTKLQKTSFANIYSLYFARVRLLFAIPCRKYCLIITANRNDKTFPRSEMKFLHSLDTILATFRPTAR